MTPDETRTRHDLWLMTHRLQVQVDMGTGMGRLKSTHGLPMQLSSPGTLPALRFRAPDRLPLGGRGGRLTSSTLVDVEAAEAMDNLSSNGTCNLAAKGRGDSVSPN